ncbi:MAG: ABC transporter substrate-binding protein [Anaerolineae bacterium]
MKRVPLLLLALVLALAVGSITAQSDANTLVVAINADVQGFNAFAQTAVTNFVTGFLWPTLITINPQTGAVEPNLASWDVSDDGLTYTFHIQPDANWSDGTPITADDVKFFFEASQSPAVGSFMTGQFSWTALNVIDEKTLEITLPAVDCTFLTNIGWGIMPSSKFAADFSDYNTAAFNDAPDVSGGPYILDEHSPDEFIRMHANPEYWLGQPHIENLVFQIIPDNEVQFQALMSGDIDVGAVSADQDAPASSNSNLTIFRYPANTVFFTAFNLADATNPQPAYDENGNLVDQGSHPIFGDVRVRQAYAMGYDHDAVTALAGEGATRSVGPVPPGISWAYADGLAPNPYDPEAAAALLDEAGWTDSDGDGIRDKDGVPLEFQLDYPAGDTTIEGTALIIQDQLGQIGFRVNLNGAEWQSLVGARLLAQTFDAFYLSISGGAPEPDFLANMMLNSHQDIPGAGLNLSSYVNSAMDEVLQNGRSVSTCDPAERAPFYVDLQELELTDLPYDFVYSPTSRFVYNNRIQGVEPGTWGLWWNIQDWTIGE